MNELTEKFVEMNELTEKFVEMSKMVLNDEAAFVGVCNMFGVDVVYARNKLLSTSWHLPDLTTDELCEMYAQVLISGADARELADIVDELESRGEYFNSIAQQIGGE